MVPVAVPVVPVLAFWFPYRKKGLKSYVLRMLPTTGLKPHNQLASCDFDRF